VGATSTCVCHARHACARNDWRRREKHTSLLAPQSPPAVPVKPAEDAILFGKGKRWMVVRRFVSSDERAQLLSKAYRHMQRRQLHPNPCGPNRFFAKADDEPAVYVDSLLERLTRRCERCLRTDVTPSDCVLGRTISLILPGGFIHQHTDAYQPGQPGHRPELEHMRCNIVVQCANPSGRPVIDGHALPVEECDLWVFFASKSPHQTLPLQGADPRIVFGFGWSVPPEFQLRPPPTGWRSEEHDSRVRRRE